MGRVRYSGAGGVTGQPAPVAVPTGWRQPVDPAAYDCTPELRPAERVALGVIVDRRDRHRRRDERAMAALERLCVQRADVPTPAGPTPRQLGATTASSPA